MYFLHTTNPAIGFKNIDQLNYYCYIQTIYLWLSKLGD